MIVIARHSNGTPREIELTRGEAILSQYFDEYLDAGLGCNAAVNAAVLYTGIPASDEFRAWLVGSSAAALDDIIFDSIEDTMTEGYGPTS